MKPKYLGIKCSLLAACSIAIAMAVSAEVPEETYSTEYTEQYLKDCLTASMSEGLAEPEAQNLCNCTLREFQQQYTLTAFQELNAKAETDQVAANELIGVGQFCFESLLFE